MNYFWTKEVASTNPFYTYIYQNYYNMDTMNPNSKYNQPILQTQKIFDKYDWVNKFDDNTDVTPNIAKINDNDQIYLQQKYKTDEPILSYTKKKYPTYKGTN
jgi:hypothetical protein